MSKDGLHKPRLSTYSRTTARFCCREVLECHSGVERSASENEGSYCRMLTVDGSRIPRTSFVLLGHRV